jgi:hypothetical protein
MPVASVFVGTEELGLHGSSLFLQQGALEFAGFVNIESIAPGYRSSSCRSEMDHLQC